jgi:hypothetical protein
MIVAKLESIFTGDPTQFDKTATTVETRQKSIDGKVTTATIDADATAALDSMDKVDAAGKKIASAETVARVDADITKAQTDFDRITAELDVLRQSDATPQVTADISKAESALAKADASLSALRGARATMVVEADTSKAEGDLDGLADKAASAGSDGGDRAGKNLGAGILAAIATIPIAGAVVGIGQAIGDSLMEGLEGEVNADLLAARTGLDEATVARLGRAAGEAYAGNFGASIEANMDTARIAVQSGLLDPKATAQDAQDIIQSLSGVADILGEDIPNVARAAAQILRTGLAKDAQGAFDLIVKGQQAGLNVSEDLLDTFNEYGTQFRKIGLEGPEALGLMSQAVQAGARDTDVAADALKEFSIRAVDGSALSAEGFEAVGLNAEKMTAQIAKGGDGAAKGLDAVLDGLRKIEDPVKRDAAAVALFGTQAEDLGEALFKMDLSNAVKQLGSVEGAAQSALDTLGDNASGKLDSAVRNIDLAATQVKTSLAVAFSPEIEGFADFVTQNREKVVTFLFDAADGAVELGIALSEGAASGIEAIGDFGGSLAPLIDGLADLAVAVDSALPGDQESKAFREWADDAIVNLADFDEATGKTADQIRTTLIDNALTPAQEKLSDLRIPAEAAARLSDTTGKLATSIGVLGSRANGSKLSLKLLDGQVDTTTRSGQQFDRQLSAVRGSLEQQVRAAGEAGESQKQLRGRVLSARSAFIDQVSALGLTRREAERLADKYGLIPGRVTTTVQANTRDAINAINNVNNTLNTIDGKTVTAHVAIKQYGQAALADGAVMDYYASGGFNESHVAQIAPAGAWRVWAEPETGGEAYIPLAPSKRARSLEILEETAARLGARVIPNADGSLTPGAPSGPMSATFTDAQVAVLARAVRDGASVGLARHERAQDRAAAYVGGL